MKKKQSKKRKKQTDYEIVTQDEYFYFIAGYTSSGFPYGTTWEEAFADGLVENENEGKKGGETQDEYPFF